MLFAFLRFKMPLKKKKDYLALLISATQQNSFLANTIKLLVAKQTKTKKPTYPLCVCDVQLTALLSPV